MKKGFTLVEVLAVIVILGLLVAIISPVVNNLLGDSEDALYDKQIDSIVNASKKYVVEHSELLPEENGVKSISISELINNGAIDKDKVINPKTKEEMNGCVVVSYNNEFNQYEYNYSEQEKMCLFTSNSLAVDGGLYEAQWEPGRLIYRGGNPNNYIWLDENADGISNKDENNVETELYRIISYENDGTIKVMRNQKIDLISWDELGSRTPENGNTYCLTTTDGCNAWSNQENTLYNGMSLKDLNRNFYYEYYDFNSGSLTTNEHYTSDDEYHGGTVKDESSLNVYLNNTWYNSLDFKNIIEIHSFNIGGIGYGETANEKGLEKEKYEERLLKWQGKIGLIEITEYVEASTNSNCTSVWSGYYLNSNAIKNNEVFICSTIDGNNNPIDNWMVKQENRLWTITPFSYNSTNRMVWAVFSPDISNTVRGAFGQNSAKNARDVYPVFYLKSDIVLSGEGTETNPYRID